MNTRAYISTLDSNIKAKQPERTMLEQHTQEFLNQGGEIKVVGTTIYSADKSSTFRPAVSYNKRSSDLSKKARDIHVPTVTQLLSQGMRVTNICRELGISHPTLQKIIKENNLDGFLRP